MCFVLDPVSVHNPKTKHLPQADDKRCTGHGQVPEDLEAFLTFERDGL